MLTVALAAAAPARAQEPEDAPSIREPPEVSGALEVGGELTASGAEWRPRDATPTYAWLRCDDAGGACVAIAGATEPTYLVAAADAGHRLRVRLVVMEDGVASEPVESEATGVVPEPVPPAAAPVLPAPLAAVAAPQIDGRAWVGARLRGTGGAWNRPAVTIGLRWMRCDAAGAACRVIHAADRAVYRVRRADLGARLRLAALASDGAAKGAAVSEPTAIVAPPPLLEPFPVVRVAGTFRAHATDITLVQVRAAGDVDVAAGCRGDGCPRGTRSVSARAGRLSALHRRFPAGTVLEVRVTAPNRTGKFVRLRMRPGRAPDRTDACVVRRDGRPFRCPR